MAVIRHWKRLVGGLMLGTIVSCGGGGTGPDCDAIAAALVSRIEIHPGSATVILGDSLQLVASAFSCAGPLGDVGGFQWTSSSDGIASVNGNGLVKAHTSGNVNIYASAGGKRGFALLFSRPSRVASVSVDPPLTTVTVAGSGTLTAHAFDSDNHEVTGRPVTWVSANTAVVTVNGQGVITGVSVGALVAVTATVDGKSGSSSVTVLP